MVFDDTLPNVNESLFTTNNNWTDFYANTKEIIPLNAPETHGKIVSMHCFSNADHTGDQLT